MKTKDIMVEEICGSIGCPDLPTMHRMSREDVVALYDALSCVGKSAHRANDGIKMLIRKFWG